MFKARMPRARILAVTKETIEENYDLSFMLTTCA